VHIAKSQNTKLTYKKYLFSSEKFEIEEIIIIIIIAPENEITGINLPK
jgi:hypothetical protein